MLWSMQPRLAQGDVVSVDPSLTNCRGYNYVGHNYIGQNNMDHHDIGEAVSIYPSVLGRPPPPCTVVVRLSVHPSVPARPSDLSIPPFFYGPAIPLCVAVVRSCVNSFLALAQRAWGHACMVGARACMQRRLRAEGSLVAVDGSLTLAVLDSCIPAVVVVAIVAVVVVFVVAFVGIIIVFVAVVGIIIVLLCCRRWHHHRLCRLRWHHHRSSLLSSSFLS